MDKASNLEIALNKAIKTFEDEAANTISLSSDYEALGETHRAMVKALTSFKDIIVKFSE